MDTASTAKKRKFTSPAECQVLDFAEAIRGPKDRGDDVEHMLRSLPKYAELHDRVTPTICDIEDLTVFPTCA
jgi:hypothetical protein